SSSLSEEEIKDILTYIDFLYSEEGIKLLNTNEENLNLLKPEYSVIDGKLQKEKYNISFDTIYDNDYSFNFYDSLMTREEVSEFISLKTNIESFVEEFSQLFIYGNLDVTDNEVWDSYVKNLKERGIDRYIELANKNYELAMSKN
ncbi:MAG: hypothetical protein ACK5LY_09300, partial [Lachnospirales bacterium]